MSLATFALVCAFVFFIAASFNASTKVNLVAIGLACCVVSALAPFVR